VGYVTATHDSNYIFAVAFNEYFIIIEAINKYELTILY